jgi:hypothetical protein
VQVEGSERWLRLALRSAETLPGPQAVSLSLLACPYPPGPVS